LSTAGYAASRHIDTTFVAAAVPFTRACTLGPVVEVLQRCGAPVEKYLSTARIDPAILDDPDAPVPLFFALHFADHASRAAGIEDLGLVAADRLNGLTELGTFSSILSEVPCAAAYLTEGARLVRRLTSGSRYALRRTGDGFRFRIAQPRVSGRTDAHGELYAVLATIRTLERFAGRPWRPASLRVPPWCRIGSEGRERLAIDRIEHDGEDFSFPVDAWLLAVATCSTARTEEAAHSLAAHPPELARGIVEVFDVVQAYGEVSIALAAEAAGSSVRTLQRRLSAEKTSFTRLLREWRLRHATRMLLETEAPIIEIAMELGYEDSSNFARAFRTYTGCAPSTFRRVNDADLKAPSQGATRVAAA